MPAHTLSTIDRSLYQAECSAAVILAGAIGLVLLYRRLAPGRQLSGVLPLVLAALGVRAAIVVAVSQSGSIGTTIRGTDDPAFFNAARLLASHDLWSGAWLSALKGDSLTLISAAMIKVLPDPGPDPLRLLQCVIAAFAVLLLTVAVHDLAGRGAALATGTLLLLEPSSMFFTTILQKESLVLLGESLAAFSVARLWRHDIRSAAVLAPAGILVAGSARPYAAAFLAAGLLVCALHWVVVHAGRARRTVLAGLALATLAGCAVFISSGAATSSLNRLQEFQRIETNSRAALRLDPVDFTTIGGAAQAVPQRLADFVLRPLPWQLANSEQRLGAVGTVLCWSLTLWVAAGFVFGRLRSRAVPLLYLSAAVWVGYAVTSANAGTGFRHRLHLIVLLVVIASIIWSSAPAGRRAGARLASLRGRLI